MEEELLGNTILSAGGTTTVPRQVMEVLKLKVAPHKREKILWTLQGVEVIVTKGTPLSSYKKTMLRMGGRAAVPRHVLEALKLKSTPDSEDMMMWIQREGQVIVRRGTPQSDPTD